MKLTTGDIEKIHAAVDLLFDNIKGSFIGPDFIHPRKDKNIYISFNKHLSLPGIYTMSVGEEYGKPDPETLNTLVHVADGYLESQRELTKSKIVNSVASFTGKKATLSTVLGGELAGLFTKVRENVEKIIATESNTAKNLGLMEGIVKLNLINNITDPTVAFIGSNDNHVCEECKKVLYTKYPIPKVFKLSEVKMGYHIRGEMTPSISGMHPNCRHHLISLMPGFGFDSSGSLEYKNKDFDAIKEQGK